MNDHRDLMVYEDERGLRQRVSAVADWEKRRARIMDAMQAVMGPLPGADRRCALDMRVEEETDAGSYLRRKISFISEPLAPRVPAYLLVPKAAFKRPAPAMLTLHQTTSIGKTEPVGLQGLPDLYYAHELAERGLVCLAPDYPGFGEYAWHLGTRGDFDATLIAVWDNLQALGYVSVTMKAIWDNLRALDVLQSLPFVDGARLGCIGHSRGGHNAIFTAAFDTRLSVVISCCGFCSFRRYKNGNLAGWSVITYMPRIKERYRCNPASMPFDFEEVIGALAPRAFLAVAPVRDNCFDIRGVREAMDSARPVYRLYGAEANLQAEYPDTGHTFPPASRERAYQFIDRILMAG